MLCGYTGWVFGHFIQAMRLVLLSVETNNTEVTWELAKDGASLFVSWSAGPEPTHYTVETLYPEIPALDTA